MFLFRLLMNLKKQFLKSGKVDLATNKKCFQNYYRINRSFSTEWTKKILIMYNMICVFETKRLNHRYQSP